MIDSLQACQTVKGACTLVVNSDQAGHVRERAVARGPARKEARDIARIGGAALPLKIPDGPAFDTN